MLINKIGADPEFEIVTEGRLVRADRVVRTTRLPWGEIGVDGAGVALELRPDPGSVDELVRNTAKLIVAAPGVCRGTPTTMGVGHPLGGHVHFDMPTDDEAALANIEKLVRIIDDALGPLFRALNGPARGNSPYGKRRDWRPQPWGIEYRTPPATIWAHPEVARGFLNAMITLAMSDGREMEPKYEDLLELAAFAIESGRRLHYGAWKEVAESAPRALFSVAYDSSAERDAHFESDMRDALAPLGISLLRVFPLHKRRGDWVSNIPGFGVMAEDIFPAYCDTFDLHLALSWRFRNDRAFRMAAMPAFLEAVLKLLRGDEPELDENVIVVGAVEKPTASEDAKEKVKKAAEEDRCAPAPTPPIATEDDGYVLCDGCEREVHRDDVVYDRHNGRFCPECYHETYALCDRCGHEVDRDDAYFPSTGTYESVPLCEECYEQLYAECESCGYEVAVEDAVVPTSGRYSGGYMCERCYSRWYTRCGCGREVEWYRVNVESGRTICERCAEEVES